MKPQDIARALSNDDFFAFFSFDCGQRLAGNPSFAPYDAHRNEQKAKNLGLKMTVRRTMAFVFVEALFFAPDFWPQNVRVASLVGRL